MPNPHPDRFLALLDETTGRVLDCGSGGRKLPGVVSLEYLNQGDADLLADGLDLPFADGSFALILSQAVAEHVTDPQRYVSEMVRVLRPGGLLYIEAAFLQPVHQAPTHYFNITPHGLRWLCRDLDVLEEGTLGWFSATVAWICHEAGVPDPKVPEGPEHLRDRACSGVSLLGRKP